VGKKKKNKEPQLYPVALTIAGSDSGGGAGIQADLRTFSAFGVYGSSVITAVTSQNPREVLRVDGLPPEAISLQLDAVSALSVKSVKTGMLYNAETIRSIVTKLKDVKVPVVVDPVMISTSGVKLLEDDAVEVLMNDFLHLATWITPNVPEAELLAGCTIKTYEDMVSTAKFIADKWECNVVLKGGHMESHSDDITDIVIYGNGVYSLSSPMIHDCTATHGTGCTFSAALAAAISLEFDWEQALIAAKSFVFGSLNEAVPIGEGIDAMYPPSYTYDENVTLESYE